MAYTSGTAANYKDLLAILATFAAANGWTILEQSATKLYLRGIGLTGVEEIYCGITAFENSANGHYNWELHGAWAYRAGRAFHLMPRSAGDKKAFVYLWNAPISYWMVATPRRIIMVAKISTVYQSLHLGLLNPVGTSAQFPYPLLIAGCGSTEWQAYSVTGDGNRAFWANTTLACGSLSLPGGYWADINSTTIPIVSASYEVRGNIVTGVDGTYMLEQLFCTDANQTTIFGAIDGLFRVSGYSNSAENIITVSGINYLVVPDVYRITPSDFCALRMN